MTTHHLPQVARALLAAALLGGVAAAQAAAGYTVESSQESLVTPGMSASEVEAVLGHPAKNVQYGNEPGPTFSYRLAGDQQTLFDVDFDADGKVLAVSERQDDSGHARGGRR